MDTKTIRRLFSLSLIISLCLISFPAKAQGETLFGPKEYKISRWYFRFSINRFKLDGTGEAILRVTKNTPQKSIWGGWVFLNRDYISLDSFLEGGDTVFERAVSLRSRNLLTVSLWGKPGASITIEIEEKANIPPPEVSLFADPSTIMVGEPTTLTWNTTNAETVSIDPGIGTVSPNGSLLVSPEQTTTYTLTAQNQTGTASESTTVNVLHPPTVSLSVDPPSIFKDEPATLSWNSTHADSAMIDQGVGDVPVNGALEISPVSTTTYTITVEGPGGTASDSVEVALLKPPDDVDHGLDPGDQAGGGLVGENICILSGNALESRSDIEFASPNTRGFTLKAFYNSRSERLSPMGYGWTHTYSVSLDPQWVLGGRAFLRIVDQTGRARYFEEKTTGLYKGIFKEKTHITADAGGYMWYRLDGTRLGFSSTGRLDWMEDEKGNQIWLTFNAQGLLETVTDAASGRTLTLLYDQNDRLVHISGPPTQAVPDGIWVGYTYDESGNLISVTYADGSGLDYQYADPSDIHNLTEKRNKLGHLINTWAYDVEDRVIEQFSVLGRGVNISYVTDTEIAVTDAYGITRNYMLAPIGHRKRVISMTGVPQAPYSDTNAVRWAYDSEMRLTELESPGGTVTQYLDYDERGNAGTVILASGTPEERRITYTYHPTMNRPLTVTEPSVLGGGNRLTIWDYDDDYDTIPNENPTGKLSRLVEQGFTADPEGSTSPFEYVTTYHYNDKGQVVAVDGPRPGTDDTTSFTYDTSSGDLLTLNLPITGTTAFSDYDGAGRPGRVTDVNGQSTSFEYDGKGRVTVIRNVTDGSSTTISYNAAGDPEAVTDPDQVTRYFDYDADYGRLSAIRDQEGNVMAYCYDAQGNRIELSKYHSTGNRSFIKRWDYNHPDIPGKLYREIQADNSFTEYAYDGEGNITAVIDPNGNTTHYGYDLFNRLTSVTQPGAIITAYTYDLHGNLISVRDAQGHETTYQYDDQGRLTYTNSPDTGTASYLYDEASNLRTKTDAKGVSVTYDYDSLNRLTHIHFPDPSQDIAYTYDQGPYGLGRLTALDDPSGHTDFFYDERGRLVEKTTTILGHPYTLSRTYSPGNRVLTVTYPSGRVMHYTRDVQGRMTGLSTEYNGNTVTLAAGMSYNPFGSPKGMGTGSGGEIHHQYAECGCIQVANPGALMERAYTYDHNRNLTSITAPNMPWYNQTFSYDALNRLIQATGRYGTVSYTYDHVGNRLTRTTQEETQNYLYMPGSNKLQEVNKETDSIPFLYDANGSTTAIGDKLLFYNQNNRLVRVEENSTILAQYTYNALGERVKTEADGIQTNFLYGLGGQLIAESTPQGTITKEYLYMGKIRVAMVDVSSQSIFYYLNDRLGTPQLLTDKDGVVVWEAMYEPFGQATVHPESSVVNNLRFPGQYYDQETGFHYNYYRYYDPGIGRYLRPDPIGQKGGVNLYAYCLDNPTNITDPAGQVGIPGIVIGVVSGACGGWFAGMRSGNLWAGIAGGVVGGLTGGLVGFAFPSASSVVGGMLGGAVSGALGGGFGGMTGKHLEDPQASTKEVLYASFKGAGIGSATGAISGGLATAAVKIVGASGVAAALAGTLTSFPIGLTMELIEVDIEDQDHKGTMSLPTITGEFSFSPQWLGNLQLITSADEVDPYGFIEVWVDPQGLPFAPYHFSLAGTGFHFDSIDGPETVTIYDYQEVLDLWADDMACGPVEITVRDYHGRQATEYVRSTSGAWITKGHYCGVANEPSATDLWISHPYIYVVYANNYQYQKLELVESGGSRGCAGEWKDGLDYNYYCAEIDCDKWGHKEDSPCLNVSELLGCRICNCRDSNGWHCMIIREAWYLEYGCE